MKLTEEDMVPKQDPPPRCVACWGSIDGSDGETQMVALVGPSGADRFAHVRCARDGIRDEEG